MAEGWKDVNNKWVSLFVARVFKWVSLFVVIKTPPFLRWAGWMTFTQSTY